MHRTADSDGGLIRLMKMKAGNIILYSPSILCIPALAVRWTIILCSRAWRAEVRNIFSTATTGFMPGEKSDVKISGNVDFEKEGTYTVDYQFTSEDG